MKQGLQLLLAALMIMVGGFVGYKLLFARSDGPSVAVLDARGEVTRTRRDGSQEALSVGDELQRDDSVRVGDDSRAVLGVGDGTVLELEARSAVRVLDVDVSGLRVELEQGRVKARVRAGGVPVGVTSRGRAIYADDADFVAAVDGTGGLAVEPERGEVRVEGVEGGARDVPTGKRLSSVPGRPPVVEAVPRELLLEVGRPGQALTRQPDILVEGRTGAYAEVRVGHEGAWTSVRAGPDGRFRASVPLEEGENRVVVEARDALGNRREDEVTITRDSTAPPIGTGEVQWGP
ncbi:MAG: hypothetical protein D6798_00125 [Deltaproteobacteria bacterium]|nr:MAG: hypothetical protein D6798_00125 [Deltaproteobacteria bacterium]